MLVTLDNLKVLALSIAQTCQVSRILRETPAILKKNVVFLLHAKMF